MSAINCSAGLAVVVVNLDVAVAEIYGGLEGTSIFFYPRPFFFIRDFFFLSATFFFYPRLFFFIRDFFFYPRLFFFIRAFFFYPRLFFLSATFFFIRDFFFYPRLFLSPYLKRYLAACVKTAGSHTQNRAIWQQQWREKMGKRRNKAPSGR